MSRPSTMPADAPRSDGIDRLGRSSRSTLLGSVVSAVLGFVLLLVLTNGLQADDAGVVLIAVAAANIAIGAAVLGTDAALVRFIAGAARGGAAGQTRRLTLIGVGPVAVVGSALGVLGWFGAGTLADLMVDGPVTSDYVDSMRVAALAVPAGAISLSVLAATRGMGSMAPTVWFDQILRPVIQTVALLVAVALSATAPGATAAWLWPFAPVLIGSVVWLLRRAPHDSVDAATVSAGRFWRFAMPQAGTGLLRVLIRWVDTLIVGALLGVGPAAIYTAATRLLKLGSIVNQAVFRASAPQIAEELSVGDHEAAQGLYRTSANWLVVATWPLYLGCLVYAPTVLAMFGPEFVDGADAVRILAVAMLVASACGPVESVLVMGGRSSLNLVNNTAALAADVGFALLLIPHWGIEGAAVAWAISVGFTNLLPLIQVARDIGIQPFDAVMARSTVGLCSAFALAWALHTTIGDGAVSFVVSAGVGGAVAAGLMWRRRDELALSRLVAAGPTP